MNRNKNSVNKGRGKSNQYGRRRGKGKPHDREAKYDADSAKLDAEGRPNDPNYYFLSKDVAEQVSQLAFQTLGGVPRYIDSVKVTYPDIKVHYWNPSAGVNQTTSGLEQSGINMAGLRIFTKLSAYTGRTAIYGPQDLSTMILALGEVISVMEWIRRVFGISFLGSEENRSYPRALMQAMRVNDVDFYPRYAEYRNRFNKLVTLINQIPFPKNIAYFDKCAHMFEKVYLDDASPLATAIVDNIATTWLLDETSYSGGTILKTCTFTYDPATDQPVSLQNLSYYLDWAEFLITALLNSSTLQVVYTDMLNLATKLKVEFWKFDYLIDGYMVVPEYNPKYLLQMHNATIVGMPNGTSVNYPDTPSNDVYPDASNNYLIYNPYKACYVKSGNIAVWGSVRMETIIDSLDPHPDTVDRIEMIRWTSLWYGDTFQDGGGTWWEHNFVLPDHYLVADQYNQGGIDGTVMHSSVLYSGFGSTPNSTFYANSTKVDWDLISYQVGAEPTTDGIIHLNGNTIGDLNYYTIIDRYWLKPIFDFTALALYDMR